MKKKIAVCIMCMLMVAGLTLNVFAKSDSVSGRCHGYRYGGTMTLTEGRFFMSMSITPLSGAQITSFSTEIDGTAFTKNNKRVLLYKTDASIGTFYFEDWENAPDGEVFDHSIGSFYMDYELIASCEVYL